MGKKILVKKASGEVEAFQPAKLERSLRNSGATESEISGILSGIRDQLHDGMTTKKIYSHAFKMLRNSSYQTASRYSLRRGIMELGPSGFPFERFIARIFAYEGFEVRTGSILNGKCVTHEIDVIAESKTEIHLVECKYHNSTGISVDVKTPLYVHSRFQDVLEKGQIPGNRKFTGWIATNSKFTGDAKTYSACRGMQVLAWDYPEGTSLKDKIERTGLYPITCMNTLNKQEKQWMLEQGYVLAQDVLGKEALLAKAGVSAPRLIKIREEALTLCSEKS